MFDRLSGIALCGRKQGTEVDWHYFEQLPVVPIDTWGGAMLGEIFAKVTVKTAVLKLSYTAHDMASFAIERSYADKRGNVR